MKLPSTATNLETNAEVSSGDRLAIGRRDPSVQAAFERRAAAHGERPAIIAGPTTVSYRELDRQASAIAQGLLDAGIAPGQFVGICIPRSVAQVAAVLGVLKAGAAYLPIDTAYPAERIRFMLEDAKVPVLLTSAGTPDLVTSVGCQKLLVETLASCPGSARTIPSPAANNLPAYLIYTSGSTGRPKGVVMPHRALVNLLCWHERVLPVPARTLQFAPLSFDVSFQEIFTTLSAGSTLVLTEEAQRRDPNALWRLIKDASIERLFIPFVGLQQLAEVVDGACRLREVITAGEQLRVTPQIRRMFTHLAPCKLYNHYGPSETHVVTAYELPGTSSEWPALPPIGKPIDRTHITLRPGAATQAGEGEILIAGDCLCDGYLHRPELNAEKFIVLEDCLRYYRTGDLGRTLEDGNLQFLGRIDDQVKIRGFRVELGEVESLISEYPGVRAVSVAAKADAANELRLVAYLVTEGQVSTADLRANLAARVPEYLVPSHFISLPALPKTPSGKVDRRALPEISQLTPVTPPVDLSPSTVEASLVAAWHAVLGHADFKLNDNFFDVGGDSLRVVRLQRHIQDQLKIDLELTELFEHPSIQAFAAHLAAKRSGKAHPASTYQERSQKQRSAFAVRKAITSLS